MVTVHGINATKRRKNGNYLDTSKELPTWAEFHKLAIKLIRQYASRSLAAVILRDEDAIDLVRQYVMEATCKHREDGGMSLKSLQVAGAKFAIKRWFGMQRRGRSVSLDYEYEDHEDCLYDRVYSNMPRPDEIAADNERAAAVGRWFRESLLTPRQRECLHLRFWRGMNHREIAAELGITAQRVGKAVEAGMALLMEQAQELIV